MKIPCFQNNNNVMLIKKSSAFSNCSCFFNKRMESLDKAQKDKNYERLEDDIKKYFLSAKNYI